MKILKTFTLFAFMLLLMVACDEKRETNEETTVAAVEAPNPDDAMNNWRDAWNASDVQRLKDYTADDAILLMWGKNTSGNNLNSWMDTTASWIQDLRTSALMTNKGDYIAWETGTYTHGTSQNDTLQLNGTYTVIWERADDEDNGDWRIKVMDISPEQEPMQEEE